MVRLTGYVIIDGRKTSLDWTVMPDGVIVNAGNLSSSNVEATVDITPPAPPVPEPLSTPAPVEETPTDYESMNKTELMTLCSQRGLSTSGTKAELIARLEADDSGEAEAVSEGETDEESQPQ